MLVLLLIALTLGATSLHMPRWIAHHRFVSDTDHLLQSMALAEALICTQSADVTLHCQQESTGIRCTLKSPLGERTEVYRHITDIAFAGQHAPLILHFDAARQEPPRGTLTLSGQRETRHVECPGYPGGMR